MNIAIIGAGNMGSAFLKGLANSFPLKDLAICDRDLKKIKALQMSLRANTLSSRASTLPSQAGNLSSRASTLSSRASTLPSQANTLSLRGAQRRSNLGDSKSKRDYFASFTMTDDPNDILPNADIIILAIKPQSFSEFCEHLKVPLAKKLIISVMAGVSIATIKQKLKVAKIIRSMPNLPAQVGYGTTGWLATKNVTAPQKKMINKIFSSLGTSIELRKEEDIDSITALSGSGPAYFFYLCEMLTTKARKLGFTEDQSKKIAESTFIGAAKLLEKNSLTTSEWRKAVTSKGGTTEAALTHLYANNFEKIFSQAIDKAKDRAIGLNKIDA